MLTRRHSGGPPGRGLKRNRLLVTMILLDSSILAGPLGVEGSQAPSEKSTTVALGTVSGAPKSQVMVPLFLTPVPPETPVARISAEIRFENKAVSFLRAEKGFLLDGVNAGIEAKIEKDTQNSGRSVLRLEVATGGEPRKALREGLVLSLLFRIEAGAPTGTTVALDFQKLSASDPGNPPQPIEPIAGRKGMIEILTPEETPYVACFLFSH